MEIAPEVETKELEVCIADQEESREQSRVGLCCTRADGTPDVARGLLQQRAALLLESLEPFQSVDVAKLAWQSMQPLLGSTRRVISLHSLLTRLCQLLRMHCI